MASQMYGKGREKFGNAEIDWVSDDIKAVLVDLGAYTPSIDVDEFLSDIPSGARIGTPVALATRTNVLGVLDADDVSVTGLSGAPTLEAIAIFKDTGVAGTSALIALIDTATGLPVAAGATQVNIAWSNGSNRILKI